MSAPETTRIELEHVTLNVARAGDGPALLLLHGWPHTWRVWSAVLPTLATTHSVIAPDLRGLGASTRPADGYDAVSIARDLEHLLDALGVGPATVLALDASVPAAFVLALTRPERVERLVLMESLVGTLPGAEAFLAGGAPWWFGFHAVPGLAENVLVGHEADYVDHFLRAGTVDGRGIDSAIRDEFVAAYTGRDALRAGFEYYRAMPTSGRQIAELTAERRLITPTLAIGANAVGDALHRQLTGVADDVIGHVIPDCGHIVPLDAPHAMLTLVQPFLRTS